MAYGGAWPWFLLRCIGGFGLLMGGLFLLRRALHALAAQQVQAFLARWTGGRWRAATAGFLAATVVQSSSLTNLIVVNLTHARWLSTEQAVAIILGANVGTTTTVQLIALRPGEVLPYGAALSLLLAICGRGRWRWAGMALGGLVGVLAGIDVLGQGLAGLTTGVGIPGLEGGIEGWARSVAGAGLWPALAIGTFITAVVQSSSVTIGMAMALVSAGVVTPAQGIAFTLGANVGTVGSTVLGAVGASAPARRAAYADLLFNVGGVLIAWPFLPHLTALTRDLTADPARQIAAAHTVFNGATVVLGLLLLQPLVKAAHRLAPNPPGSGE